MTMRPQTQSGFTLLEVVIALLVLEVAVVGLVGSLVLASATLRRAESLERAVATAEGVLDSLDGIVNVRADSVTQPGGGTVKWSAEDSGQVTLRAIDAGGALLFDIPTVLAAPR